MKIALNPVKDRQRGFSGREISYHHLATWV